MTMRKFFFMLVALFCCMFTAVQAQSVTSLSQLDNDKVYTLRSARAFLLYSPARPNELCSSNGKAVGTVTQNAEDPNQQFRIEKKGSSYYLYSVGAEKYVSANGSYVATASAALTLENVGGSYPWKLLIGGNGLKNAVSFCLSAHKAHIQSSVFHLLDNIHGIRMSNKGIDIRRFLPITGQNPGQNTLTGDRGGTDMQFLDTGVGKLCNSFLLQAQKCNRIFIKLLTVYRHFKLFGGPANQLGIQFPLQ